VDKGHIDQIVIFCYTIIIIKKIKTKTNGPNKHAGRTNAVKRSASVFKRGFSVHNDLRGRTAGLRNALFLHLRRLKSAI
jgi:hypothetical protein